MFLMRTNICVMVTLILTPIYLVFNKPKSYNDTFSRDGNVVTRSYWFANSEILNFETFIVQ